MAFRRSPKKLSTEELWDYALKELGRRAHSGLELKDKLRRRAAQDADVQAVMVKLRDYGLSDDRRYSEAFAASRLQNEGLGRLRVLRDLRAKRVSDRVAAPAVERVYSEVNEADLIEAFLKRKYRNVNLAEFLQEQKNLASAYRRLRNAGFNSGAIFRILKQYAAAVEEWTEPEEEGGDHEL